MGHTPREISRHVYYFIKTEDRFLNSSVMSTKYRPSPIRSGRLEILLLLKFFVPGTGDVSKNEVNVLVELTT